MKGPRRVRLPRQLRCDWKLGSIAHTFGRLLTNDCCAPAKHAVGIDASFAANALKSGTGTADPTHNSCLSASDKPVFETTGAMSPGRRSFRNSPMPPERIPHGAPNPGIPVVPL